MGIRCLDFQRFRRPIPSSGKGRAIVKPQHVADGRRTTRHPRTLLSPEKKANALEFIIGSQAVGPRDCDMNGKDAARTVARLPSLSRGVLRGVMALRHRALEADEIEERRVAGPISNLSSLVRRGAAAQTGVSAHRGWAPYLPPILEKLGNFPMRGLPHRRGHQLGNLEFLRRRPAGIRSQVNAPLSRVVPATTRRPALQLTNNEIQARQGRAGRDILHHPPSRLFRLFSSCNVKISGRNIRAPFTSILRLRIQVEERAGAQGGTWQGMRLSRAKQRSVGGLSRSGEINSGLAIYRRSREANIIHSRHREPIIG